MTDDDAAATEARDGLRFLESHPDGLEEAAGDLEQCLGAPSETDRWRVPVVEALGRVHTVLEAHSHDLADGGALADSLEEDGQRLAGEARRLAEEHDELLEIQRRVAVLAQDETSAADDVRDAASELASLMRRHAQRAQDLIHDALEADSHERSPGPDGTTPPERP